jgi:hypothetical protein
MVVQTALKALGKYEGGIDGQIGRKSRAAIADLQTQLGLPSTGAIDQTLLDGLGVPSGGPDACIVVDLPPLPKPPRPQCDKGTTVSQGGECLCKFKDMYQKDDTSCGCVKGTKFTPGKGCLKPRQVEISKPKPKNKGPKCDPATTIAQGGQCVCLRDDLLPISPTKCAPKDFVKHQCAKDQTFIKGLGCVEDRIFFGDGDSAPKGDKPPGTP